jgi:iron complex transport system substrate-binding protein
MRRRFLLGAPALLLSRSARATGWPRVVTDGLGRHVEIAAPPQRIVAIFASNAEMLAALGLADRIAAIEAYTRFPPEIVSKPLIGGRLGFSAEAIARLPADLVVMTPARQAAQGLTEPLARAGIPSIVLTQTDLRQITANIRLLGLATGAEARAEDLVASMEARTADVASRIAGRPRPSVFLETSSTGRGVFGTVRSGTYTDDILHLGGGKNIFSGLANAGPSLVSGEAILRADPDQILVAGTPAQAAALPSRAAFGSLEAVRTGHVATVSRAFLLIPGPRVVDGIEQIARLLHPDAFA